MKEIFGQYNLKNYKKSHNGLRLKPIPRCTTAQDRIEADTNCNFKAKYAVPLEVVNGPTLDLSVWSAILRNSDLKRLAQQIDFARTSNNQNDTDGDGDKVRHSVDSSKSPRLSIVRFSNLMSLSLAGADQITDKGLAVVGSVCKHLTCLNLERAVKLSDMGIARLLEQCNFLEILILNEIPSLVCQAMDSIVTSKLPLRELHVSNCCRIQHQAFFKVFSNIHELELINISYCKHVDDTILKVIGDYCTQIHTVLLRGCRQVSSTGITDLASHCPNLNTLDLARHDLPYKILDVSLLSLSENCRLLNAISVSGCDFLSDSGIYWLATGCSAIRHLDVSGCSKLTDASMRVIGANFVQLESVNIQQCTRISNTGLQYIAAGCNALREFIASGLPLINDKPTKICNDDLGIEHKALVGVMAVLDRCARLEKLDLSKCQQISDATLKFLATCDCSKSIKELKLHSCSKVADAGINAILSHCSSLTVLDAAGCERLTDHAVRLLPHLTALEHLVVLRLQNCNMLTDKALGSLLSRPDAPQLGKLRLEELNVSGCSKLTDISLFIISNSSSADTIRFLYLRNLPRLTSTGISWLSESCPKLFLLDVSGCSGIPSYSIQAISAQWQYAMYTSSSIFRGVVPKHRAEDLLKIDKYKLQANAVAIIQGLHKMKAARLVLNKLRAESFTLTVVIHLQKMHRAKVHKKRVEQAHAQQQLCDRSAYIIQKYFKRGICQKQKIEECQKQNQACSIKIAVYLQRSYRKWQLLLEITRRVEARKKKDKEQFNASQKIQAVWRGKLARRLAIILRQERDDLEIIKANKASRIGLLFLMYRAKKLLRKKQDEAKQNYCTQIHAAVKIQNMIRKQQALNKLIWLRFYKQILSLSARRIQMQWHRYQRWRLLQVTLNQVKQEKEYIAVKILRSAWKRKKDRDKLIWLRTLREKKNAELNQSAVQVQRHWRGKATRCMFQEIKKLLAIRFETERKQREKCATLIQAIYRGRIGRAVSKLRKIDKKRQWKRVVNSKDGVNFYYNIVTGEIRFRMPQDYLDMLPQPRCENCVLNNDSPRNAPVLISQSNRVPLHQVGINKNENKAHIECKDCNEYCCFECWKVIHNGGIRKTHYFRCLYDYNGKRIEYNQDDWPSLWPTEVQQDEYNGWYLRIEPVRYAAEVRGEWARYEQSPSKLSWFYCSATNENTYHAPDVFSEYRDNWGRYYKASQTDYYKL